MTVMSDLQKYKATSTDGSNVFFVEHGFDTAYAQAVRFARKNTGWTFYYRNMSNYGPTWLLCRDSELNPTLRHTTINANSPDNP